MPRIYPMEVNLLVVFLYNNYDEIRLTPIHPESLMVDTTHGTDKERKELFTIASKDGNNRAFNACRAFIPNQQQWVFHLLFSECIPLFWRNNNETYQHIYD